ncbi:TetR family transcriptional regulator [Saccharothrix australiensis]|uniref:TetR family transcriptional regulator n=1 Tax=Saccharothrix australiensis TaxID=2072 RepID=A0A495W654_9PSEU|nr:TetR family transcriptional regulator [Saccharothrix australiensis]
MPDVKHFDPDAALDTAMRLFWRRGVSATGVQDVVTATGVNRSSLYATFGGKRDLYLAALRRYVDQRSRPALRRLADDPRGLPAITDFFGALVEARCTGEHARWGCLVSNAHTGADDDPEVREVLRLHHELLRDAMRAALARARAAGELGPAVDPESAADVLALLAYGVNLRSRAGADPKSLTQTVATAVGSLATRTEEVP